MDAKGFFLGLIAAVLLYVLWKKESGQGNSLPGTSLLPASNGNTAGPGGCAGCSAGSGPSAAAAPAVQSAIALIAGPGQISPGTPPLDTAAGAGSFYADSGPTPDSGFIRSSNLVVAGQFQSSGTTSPTQPPLKAITPVADYSQQGFVARTNVTGVYTSNLRQSGYL